MQVDRNFSIDMHGLEDWENCVRIMWQMATGTVEFGGSGLWWNRVSRVTCGTFDGVLRCVPGSEAISQMRSMTATVDLWPGVIMDPTSMAVAASRYITVAPGRRGNHLR